MLPSCCKKGTSWAFFEKWWLMERIRTALYYSVNIVIIDKTFSDDFSSMCEEISLKEI